MGVIFPSPVVSFERQQRETVIIWYRQRNVVEVAIIRGKFRVSSYFFYNYEI